MATSVIMPALELAQETGKVIRWLKAPGDAVAKGEPLLEIETDKVTTEIEAPASGILINVSAQEGDVVPVGRAIAQIGAPGEAGAAAPARATVAVTGSRAAQPIVQAAPAAAAPAAAIKASPLARKIAAQHDVDLREVKTSTGRIEKADVLAMSRRGRPDPLRRAARARGAKATGAPTGPSASTRRRPRRADSPPSAAWTSAPCAARARRVPSSPRIFSRRTSHRPFQPRPPGRPMGRAWAPCGASWPSG